LEPAVYRAKENKMLDLNKKANVVLKANDTDDYYEKSLKRPDRAFEFECPTPAEWSTEL
jgi:hypothetical protein